ncbi:SCO family protein [Candidatus Liberibacter sp.]|uniref:SCO family protein n=1 Tax=Candidatus Liberibacter sp. TaxID=34022 RepID=UPI002174FD0F|nr:SCO family protein [Candidatus Liberibacter sp.]
MIDSKPKFEKSVWSGKFGDGFQLITQDGKAFTLDSLSEKPSIVFFGFTNCFEVCPTALSNLDRFLKIVDPEGSLLRAYYITVDPKRDTPEVVKKFVTQFSDRVIGVSGDPNAVMKVVKKFRIYVSESLADKAEPGKGYFLDHTTAFLLLSSHGNLVNVIPYKEDFGIAIAKLNQLIEEDKLSK